MRIKKIPLVLAVGLLASACASPPRQSPDIFYPESFWDDNQTTQEEQAERYAENWQIALEHPAVRKSLSARLLLGPGQGHRMIDGNELVVISRERPVLVRHTAGGDQNADGSWNRGCPGSFFQNRFGVYDYLQEFRPDLAVVEIHTQENAGCSPAARLMEKWAYQTAEELNREDPQLLTDFYKFWNIYKWNSEKPEVDEWLLVAHTGAERAAAVRERACDGWTYLVSPATPTVLLYENEQMVAGNGYPVPEEGEVWQTYIKEWFGAEDKQEFAQQPLTPAQLETGEVIARAILESLGLL